jgi:hypothetical protein
VTFPLLDFRRPSLLRADILVLGSVLLSLWLSDFPRNRATLLLLLPALGVIAGTAETARCIQRRWSLYHGGVILSLYMDLMCIAMVFFALIFPYVVGLNPRH